VTWKTGVLFGLPSPLPPVGCNRTTEQKNRQHYVFSVCSRDIHEILCPLHRNSPPEVCKLSNLSERLKTGEAGRRSRPSLSTDSTFPMLSTGEIVHCVICGKIARKVPCTEFQCAQLYASHLICSFGRGDFAGAIKSNVRNLNEQENTVARGAADGAAPCLVSNSNVRSCPSNLVSGQWTDPWLFIPL
jgi:hypothetical protein